MLKLVLILAVLLAIALCIKGNQDHADYPEYLTGNLARGKPSLQSSTYADKAAASKAVDGVKNPYYSQGSCSCTRRDRKPWWRVDLESYQRVAKVKLTTRSAHWGRLRNIEIIVGNVDDPHYTPSSQEGNELCAYHQGKFDFAGQSKEIVCTTPKWGRYVFVVLRVKEYLTLCEAEVFGIRGAGENLPSSERLTVNIAQGKSTQQSSTWSWPSKNAVDGKPRTCSFTYKDNDPWWRVDLGSSWTVKKVALINRYHIYYKRLAHFEIRVGMVDSRPKHNSLCEYFPGTVPCGALQMFTCIYPRSGRYVFVELRNKEYLSLCEVQVYAIKRGH